MNSGYYPTVGRWRCPSKQGRNKSLKRWCVSALSPGGGRVVERVVFAVCKHHGSSPEFCWRLCDRQRSVCRWGSGRERGVVEASRGEDEGLGVLGLELGPGGRNLLQQRLQKEGGHSQPPADHNHRQTLVLPLTLAAFLWTPRRSVKPLRVHRVRNVCVKPRLGDAAPHPPPPALPLQPRQLICHVGKSGLFP